MSLKLIKEAQLVTSISADELAALKVLQESTGKSLAQLNEAFRPSPEDYDAWLRVLVDEAQERGISIAKKSAFAELAGEMLENDPMMPPPEMVDIIISKLWNDYKAIKSQVRIDKIGQAQEEEEQLHASMKALKSHDASETGDEDTGDSRIEGAERFGRMGGQSHKYSGYEGGYPYGPGSENEEASDPEVGYCVVDNGVVADGPYHTPGEAEESIHRFYNDGEHKVLFGRAEGNGYFLPVRQEREEEEYGARQQDARTLNPSINRRLYRANDAETIQSRQRLGSQENEEDAAVMDREDEALSSRQTRRSLPLSAKSPRIGETPEGGKWVLADTDEDEEAAKKADRSPEDIANAILKAPREVMRNATKGIKDEGAEAWKKHGLPKNPHPIKSAAYRHWQSGLRKAAMSDLGLEPVPDANPKRKK